MFYFGDEKIMAFIIDSYNKYDVWDRQHARKVFEVNGWWYAIKEVEMDWGLPQLEELIDRDNSLDAKQMHVYSTYEDAVRFMLLMKGLN